MNFPFAPRDKASVRPKPARTTRNFSLFAVPPEGLTILEDDSEAHVKYYVLGPYSEGASLSITCVATGGQYYAINTTHAPHSSTARTLTPAARRRAERRSLIKRFVFQPTPSINFPCVRFVRSRPRGRGLRLE